LEPTMKLEFTPYVLPFIISTIILASLSIYAFRLGGKSSWPQQGHDLTTDV